VTGEETLDRAVAKDEPLRRKACSHLLEGGVAIWSKRRHHDFMMGLDPIRASVTAERFGAWIALFTLKLAPTADAGSTHPETSRNFAMARARPYNSQNANPKIDRQRSRHACRPPSGTQSESLRA
jgi:hypothetical protein